MERFGWILGGLALLVGAWNAWSLSALSTRLDALERPATTSPAAARGGNATPAPLRSPSSRLRAASTPETAEAGLTEASLEDPAVRAKLAEVMREEEERAGDQRRELVRESILSEVESFAAEEGLNQATLGSLVSEIERRIDNFSALRQEIRDGQLSWFEGRREMGELRDNSDQALRELLGESRFEVLDERLWGDRRRGGGRRP